MSANVIDVTLTLDTSAYASGDVLAATQTVADAFKVNGGRCVLDSLTVIDQDDQKVALTIYVLAANVAMGTENGAPSITDANALNIQAVIPVATTDYLDLGGVAVANIAVGKVVKAASGTRNLYVAAVNGAGTPTYTASGMKVAFKFLQD